MNYTSEKLANGMTFVHVPMPSNPAVTVMALVHVGAEFEKGEESGISHFLEHMMYKGTEKRQKGIDISRELDEVGASYNAFTSREYTGYYVKSAKKDFLRITDVLFDSVTGSLVRDDDAEKERGVILEEINMYKDRPQEIVSDHFNDILYGDTPAGSEVLGRKETVAMITGSDLRAFKEKYYTPDRMSIVVAGGVSYAQAKKEILRLFVQTWKMQPRKTPIKKPLVKKYTPPTQVQLTYKKTDQTHFIFGGRSCDRNHPDNYVLSVIASVLDGGMSGRIFQRVREELGAAYYAYFGVSEYTNHGNWYVASGVTNKRTKEVITESLKEIKRIKDELVSEEEIKKAKDYLIGSMLLSLETSGARARFFGFQALFGDNPILTPTDVRENIEAVTAKDIMRVARKYFKEKDMRLSIIGPHRDAAPFEAILRG